ncbi:uncharacterized protein LOC124435494 [Xenia sp. Carnegie-2017]|uniref:uncharacterized protein LOC124435494 n=1 Tax=Xenia sp. Carnegie-2017 TaxID=2897299 RepID=UPI001F048D6E|nr:uncharacterized protein LOC124435494 [Xenia sp. Carnegie-2017]
MEVMPLLFCLFAVVAAKPSISNEVTTESDLAPGKIWGPVITHAGKMTVTKDGLLHKYKYSSKGRKDMLSDFILTSEIFQNITAMHKHMKAVLKEDDLLLSTDPEALEGKYLEILTIKQISFEKVKLVCHSYKQTPAFCHKLTNTHHATRLLYSMVRETESGYVFPCLFFSHQGCSDQPGDCFWVTHINEVAIVDKDVVLNC